MFIPEKYNQKLQVLCISLKYVLYTNMHTFFVSSFFLLSKGRKAVAVATL